MIKLNALMTFALATLHVFLVTTESTADVINIPSRAGMRIVLAYGGHTPTLTFNLPEVSDSRLPVTLNGYTKFANGRRRVLARRIGPTHNGKSIYIIPPIHSGRSNTESYLEIGKRGVLLTKIAIFTARPEWFRALRTTTLLSDAIVIRGKDFAVLDEALVRRNRPEESAQVYPRAATTVSDLGTSETLFDDGSTISPRMTCSRAWIPGTRWGSGQVTWKISDPPCGHSLKDEKIDGNSTSLLRCPVSRGPNTTDYYIDGLYSVAWQTSTSPLSYRALKVPDHCTASRYSGYVDCCCNAAMSAIYGTCRFIDPRNYSSWPDVPKYCGCGT